MKKLILIFILLIGAYTLLKNNVYWIPDQIMWSTSHDFFHKTLLPFLMITSAISSILRTDKQAYFNLAVGLMVIDAVCRFFIGVDHLHGYLNFSDYAPRPIAPGSIKVVTNLWPSHFILFLEMSLIVLAWRQFYKKKNFASCK